MRKIGTIALIGLTGLLLPAGASGAVLYDQASGPADAGTVTSSDFGNASQAAQGADDFTVPAGATWNITSADFLGAGNLTGAHAVVFLFQNSGGLPGSPPFYSQPNVPLSGANNFSTPLSGVPPLGPGTYWISVQVDGSSQWLWNSMVAQFGNIAAWQNPGNGFATGCTSFTALNSCGGFTGKSFQFRLNGPDPPAPPVTPAAPATMQSAQPRCRKHMGHRGHKGATSAKKGKCKRHKRKR